MIKLTVQHYNGAPLPQTLTAHFDEMGGTIGRADNNHLVLPDPERTISRVHAQVVYRHGAYAVIDRGSNPIQHNGRVLGNGEEALLQAGDQVEIGGYLIQVEQGAAGATGVDSFAPAGAHASADPFADFGGIAFASSTPTAVPAASGSGFGGFAQAPSAPSHQLDPLMAFGTAPSATPAPFGMSSGGGIPDDWNPFAPTAAPAPASTPPSTSVGGSAFGVEFGQPAALIPDMIDLGGGQANTSSSLDAMFGLGSPSGSDPLGQSPLAPAVHGPNTSGHVDPIQALFGGPTVVAAPVPDHVSSLHEPFQAPPIAPVTASIQAPIQAVPAQSPVLSWDDGAQEGRTVIRAKVSGAPRPHAPVPPDVLTPPTAAFTNVMPTPAPAPAPVMPVATTAGAPADAALMGALAAGLGVALPPGQQLTPEFMLLIGQLLRDATQGTVDLLVARAALKREVRAEVTMIAAKENNPLKFSPSAEVALNHLLSPPVRGFMPSSLAMRDAYQDLRAHQFAFVAGMRAALEGVLQRFDPTQLEGKLTQRSGLSGLLAGSRKARMWELFVELYGQISAEASDDFHELFGKEFLRAYESHIDQLQRSE